MSFSSTLKAYLDSEPLPPAASTVDQLALCTPGVCVISSHSAVLRRRLLVALLMQQILRQIDAQVGSAQQLNVYANGSRDAMLKDLLVLEGCMDLSTLTLLGKRWMEQPIKQVSDLQLLAIAGGLDGEQRAPGQGNTADVDQFEPLYWSNDVISYGDLTSTLRTAKPRTVIFMENVHLLGLGKDEELARCLATLRNVAHEKLVTLYFGASAAPGKNMASSTDEKGDAAQSQYPAIMLPADLQGIDAFVDSLIYLEATSAGKVQVFTSTSSALPWVGRL
jgi:hypothetical protein